MWETSRRLPQEATPTHFVSGGYHIKCCANHQAYLFFFPFLYLLFFICHVLGGVPVQWHPREGVPLHTAAEGLPRVCLLLRPYQLAFTLGEVLPGRAHFSGAPFQCGPCGTWLLHKVAPGFPDRYRQSGKSTILLKMWSKDRNGVYFYSSPCFSFPVRTSTSSEQ